MTWRVLVRQAADQDLLQIKDWYESQGSGLGDEFLIAAAAAFSHLEIVAGLHPPYYKDFRRILIDRFPYKVFYRVNGDEAIVFRVLHVQRDHTHDLS